MDREIKCKVIDENTNKEERYQYLLRMMGDIYVSLVPDINERGSEAFQKDLEKAMIEAAQRDIADKMRKFFEDRG